MHGMQDYRSQPFPKIHGKIHGIRMADPGEPAERWFR
jgi:hypothetical protein